MAMFIISNLVGSTIQITTLPLPVLSTLQASGLVFNSICATLILGEPFTRWSLGGTILVSSGAVLIAIFGAIPEPAHSLDQLLDLLGRKTFVLWMIFQALLVGAIIVVAGFLSQVPSISASPRIRLWKGLAYGCVSGILSAHSLLLAKSAVELLVRTIVDSINQFNRWQSWVIVIGLITLALTQLYFLHKGLKLVSTSVLYPLVFCIYNIIAILDGLIYFDQTDRISALHAGYTALGTIILLSGVLALSWRLSDEQTQNPAVAQSALAPGLGYVEDTEDEEYSDEVTADEERAIGSQHLALLNGEPMTPTTKLDTVLGATRHVRKTVRLTEADEIWGELQDDDTKSTSPTRHRRSSTHLSLPKSPRSGDNQTNPEPTETTSLLRNNSFNRRRRRKSAGFPGFQARPASRSFRRRNTQSQQQEALGGFWKMKWWQRGWGSGKGPPGEGSGEGPGEGPSASGGGAAGSAV
jgi:hypothetical protein